MLRHSRAPAGFDSLGKWEQVEKPGLGCWWSNCLWAASPCSGQRDLSSFSCLCSGTLDPALDCPSCCTCSCRSWFFLSFITLSSDAGQHQGGVAGTAPVLSSPQPCLTRTGRQGARRQILGYLVTTSRCAVGVWSRCFMTGELTPQQSCRLPEWCCGKVSLHRR